MANVCDVGSTLNQPMVNASYLSIIRESVNIASSGFLHSHGNIATEGDLKYALCRITSMVLTDFVKQIL